MKRPLIVLTLISPALMLDAAVTITVDSGEFDRRDTMVEFDLPAGVKKASSLRDEKGNLTAVQLDGNHASFVMRELARGGKHVYQFTDGDAPALVRAEVSGGAVALSAFGQPVFTYHTALTELPPNRPDLKPIFRRAGYIHPVLSPSGLLVTDDYPPNHKHHHGIWHSWSHAVFEGRTNDYWNMGEGKGTMEFLGLGQTWSGPVHAGFTSRHQHVDLTAGKPKPALNETWKVRLFAVGKEAKHPYYMFDVDIIDTCVSTPVQLPEYRYGGICVRGNWAWNGKNNASVLTSEGETDRAKGDKGKVQARWVHLGGFVSGKFTGIAGLDHPSNFRAPEPVRLNAAEPYFNFTPQQAGGLEITPDKPWVGRYRFVVADGKPDAKELDRLWNDYAHPPKVTVSGE